MTKRDAGFTLLEMLVALVVFGLVMAGLAQAFRFGLTAWSAGARNTAMPENMAAVDSALTRMIEQTLPGSLTGQTDQLAFTTRLPEGAGPIGGLADAALLAPGGDLILRYTPHPPGIPLGPPPPPKVELLAQGVAGLTVTYLVPQTGAPPVWSSTWAGAGLPLLVRVHCRFADGRNWPDLVVTPGG
ncbi:MAG: prepilin-type N-terminal cleavage/methylation domain-containing protein [Acidocella sp.]|nr:prepilin-type N-terminal cleavage/methylation domain-containing protein [Acidocella sp.]